MPDRHQTLRTLEPEEEQFRNIIADLHALPSVSLAEDFEYTLKQRIASTSFSATVPWWRRFFFYEHFFPLRVPVYAYGIVATLVILLISYYVFTSSDLPQNIDSIPHSEEQLQSEQPLPSREGRSDKLGTQTPAGSSSESNISQKNEVPAKSSLRENDVPQSRRRQSPIIHEKKFEQGKAATEEQEFMPSVRGIVVDQDDVIDSTSLKDSSRNKLHYKKPDIANPDNRNNQRAR